jgi:Transposase, Mutator family
MADSGSLGVRAELGKVLESEHADLLREGVALVLREVMEMEVARLAGAERYERSGERAAYRNGYRPRELPPGWARWSCTCPSCVRARATCPASSRPASAPSRRSWPWSWRPTSTASPPARWSAWSSSSGWRG